MLHTKSFSKLLRRWKYRIKEEYSRSVKFFVGLHSRDMDERDILHTEPLLWKLPRQVDDRIEPFLIARDTDYAGFIKEIKQTGIEIVK